MPDRSLNRARQWAAIALLNLFIATLMGVLLRYAFVEELSFLNFRYFLHGHSHVAMLGWGYLILFCLMVYVWLPDRLESYQLLFRLTQFSVIGMLISFPIQGYGPVSIGFSTLHILLSYWFFFKFWKDLKTSKSIRGSTVWFVKAGLLFMVLSTFSLWALGPIIVFGAKGTAIYYLAVQFFLHFQFNGWYLFTLLALLLHYLTQNEVQLSRPGLQHFFILLTGATLLTFALAVTWSNPSKWLFGLNSLGVLLQLAALVYWLFLFYPFKKYLPLFTKSTGGRMMGIAIIAFVLKILIQGAVVIPFIAVVAYTIRNFVIGFIHLMLLGLLSCFVLGYGMHLSLIRSRWFGAFIFTLGFLLTETLLFLQGLLLWIGTGFIPHYYELIFGASVVLSIGTGIIFVSQFGWKSTSGMDQSKL